MEKYQKIIEVLENIKKEETKKELQKIKSIAKFNRFYYSSVEYETKAGGQIYFDKLTERQQQKTIAEQKEILTKKALKKIEKEYQKKFDYIKELANTEPVKQIEIAVIWSNGSVYGWQARAKARYETASKWAGVETSLTSGCGYDKRSTATSKALNQIEPLFVIIANKLEKLPKKQIKAYLTHKSGREFIGYGFDFFGGVVGSFSYGVGFECHRENLKKLGFDCVSSYEGNREEFYTFINKKIK